MKKKKSKKQMIFELMQTTSRPIACHEFLSIYHIPINDHSANARINELRIQLEAEQGIYRLKKQRREGHDYDEWFIEYRQAEQLDLK
ncbi:hypothetical protein LCGC14_1060930 [marine sediment metagenome]|uniref:Uncharacterized protein n=1 Tax=marine sediment metagenome TaxID=412755 RepID=A0A0F9N845_9ZZZZ